MTRSRGFTLIELLVVVAILGIISAIGIVSYNGYIQSTKQRAAENVIQQISLVQAEHKNEYDYYETTGCPATAATSLSVEKKLFGLDSSATETTIITDDKTEIRGVPIPSFSKIVSVILKLCAIN